MNTMITMTLVLTRNQAAILVNLAQAEAKRIRNRVPLESRTPLLSARLDDLDRAAYVLTRAGGER